MDTSWLRKFNSERKGGVGITEEVKGKEGGGGGMERGVKGRKCEGLGEFTSLWGGVLVGRVGVCNTYFSAGVIGESAIS